MPDQTNDPAAVASQDNKGYVHIEMDAPVGSVITQPLSDDAQQPPQEQPTPQPTPPPASPPPIQPAMELPPPGMPPPQQLSDFAVSPSDSSKPSEVQEVEQQLQEARAKEQAAKHKTEAALQQVQQLEEQAKSAQQQLAGQTKQAQEQVEQAQSEIEEAVQKQQDSQQKVQELKGSSGGGLSIAGYKPMELVQALNSPPSAAMPSEQPKLDKSTQKEVEQQIQETQSQVKETQSAVQSATKEIEKANKFAQKTLKQQDSIIQKIVKLLQGLGGSDQESKMQPYKAFFVIGAIMLILTLITVPFASPFIWMLIGLAAVVQIGMGTMLKKKSQ